MQGDSESGNPNQPCISTLPNSLRNDSKRQLAGQRRQLRMSYHFGLGDRGPDYTSRVCKQRSSQTAAVKASSRSITNLQQTAACQSRARRGCRFKHRPAANLRWRRLGPRKTPRKRPFNIGSRSSLAWLFCMTTVNKAILKSPLSLFRFPASFL